MEKVREIKDSYYHKFEGVAPEGFLLVPEEIFDLLREFDEWKNFKNDPEWVYNHSKRIVVNEKK